MTVTFTVQDNADNENGRRLQRSTDGGSTWSTVDDIGPDETQFEDSTPVLYEPVLYRSQVYTEHVVSNSGTVEVVAVEAEQAYAELEDASGTITVVGPGEWRSISIQPEHTGLWGADLNVAPGDRTALDRAFEDLRIYYGDQQFFEGECLRPSLDDAVATLAAYGKGVVLEEDTAIVTYPDALGKSTARLSECIADYWSRTPAAGSVTVHEPTPTTIRQGELFYDAPTPTGFDEFVSAPADVPVSISASSIDHTKVRFFEEAENASGSGIVIDTVDAPSDHSNFEAVELGAAGAKREIQFTPQHDIPWDDFAPRVRYEYENFDGYIYVTLDGQRIGIEAVGGPATDSATWRGAVNLSANVTVDSPPADPLKAGTTYSFGIEVDTDNNGDFAGRCIVDCLAPGDSGDRFGGYSITEDNSVDTNDGTIDGPEEYARATDVSFDVDEVWRVSESTVDITIDDTSNGQAITQAVASDVAAANTAAQTVDWDSENQYGMTVTVTLTLSRYTDDSLSSPAAGDAGQSVTGLEATVDTDDTDVVESSNPVELDANTHLANAQTLHEAAPWRFVTDHSVSGLVIESFRKGDPNVKQTADWTLEANGDSEERETRGYANRVNGYGDGVSASIIHTAEVNRVGQEVPIGRTYPTVSDRDALVDELRRELLRLVTNDERSGRLEIAPQLVLPGYPYDVPAFDGEQANLNGAPIEFGASGGRGELQFGTRRSLAQRVARQD